LKPLLLIQARDEPHIQIQEQECFLDRCQVEPSLLHPVSVLETEMGTVHLSHYSAILIGGAGAYSAASDYPWMSTLLEFVRECIAVEKPMFGSCWGHQIIARAAGGTVIHDASKAELGSIEICVAEAGREDPLFRFMPERFFANAGHHDRVSQLPPGAIELARNESQPNQAFRLGNLPVYGTQFHSELDAKAERERLIEYRDHYREDIPSEEDFQRIMSSLKESTAADKLLRYFLDDFVL
jgi:GMP synthase (glutamine-hydrolysing)